MNKTYVRLIFGIAFYFFIFLKNTYAVEDASFKHLKESITSYCTSHTQIECLVLIANHYDVEFMETRKQLKNPLQKVVELEKVSVALTGKTPKSKGDWIGIINSVVPEPNEVSQKFVGHIENDELIPEGLILNVENPGSFSRIITGFKAEFIRMYGEEFWQTMLHNVKMAGIGVGIGAAVAVAHLIGIGQIADIALFVLFSAWVVSNGVVVYELIKMDNYEGVGALLARDLNDLIFVVLGGVGAAKAAAKFLSGWQAYFVEVFGKQFEGSLQAYAKEMKQAESSANTPQNSQSQANSPAVEGNNPTVDIVSKTEQESAMKKDCSRDKVVKPEVGSRTTGTEPAIAEDFVVTHALAVTEEGYFSMQFKFPEGEMCSSSIGYRERFSSSLEITVDSPCIREKTFFINLNDEIFPAKPGEKLEIQHEYGLPLLIRKTKDGKVIVKERYVID